MTFEWRNVLTVQPNTGLTLTFKLIDLYPDKVYLVKVRSSFYGVLASGGENEEFQRTLNLSVIEAQYLSSARKKKKKRRIWRGGPKKKLHECQEAKPTDSPRQN